jgi:hypothetical protein
MGECKGGGAARDGGGVNYWIVSVRRGPKGGRIHIASKNTM